MATSLPEKNSGSGGHGGPGGPGGPGNLRHGFAKPKHFKKTFFRIFSYLSGSKGMLVLVCASLLMSAASGIAGSYFLRPLINNYILPKDFSGLASALCVLAVIYLSGAAASYLQTQTTIRLAQKTVRTIRKELFDKMQNLPLRYFDTHTHGELMSRFTNDADNVQMLLDQSLTQLISSGLTFAGVVVCMLVLSPILFIITALMISSMIFFSARLGKKTQQYFKGQQKLLGALNGYIEESIGSLKEIKAFNHESKAKEEFEKINEEFRQTATSASFFAGAIMPIMVNLNQASYAVTAVFGGLLTIFGRFDVGSLAAYLQFSRQIGQPINQITSQMNNVFSAVAGAERIFAMMDEIPEVNEGLVTLAADKDENGVKRWFWVLPDGTKVPLKGDVRFHDVSFSYEPSKPILKNVSLYAKPGQLIAFVGATGAGKTTITNLINRFYDIQDGHITYDGIDVKDIKKDSLRQSLGMVLQDTHLFTGTIMDNIRYGRLDATDAECVEAAKKANADSFINRLSQSYQTQLTGDGGNLSQGQRQLLAIARAYIANPPVMILDEATSSIDTRTERLVQQGMNELMKDRTVFVIAHRLSTVRNAKAIIVLEQGEIIERGNHEELLAEQGRYYQLHHGLAELN